MATPVRKFLDPMIEDIMSEQDYRNILEVLAQHESMPFLELSALVDMDDSRLEQLVDDLESKGILKVTSRGNILDEIVTLREKAFTLVSTAP